MDANRKRLPEVSEVSEKKDDEMSDKRSSASEAQQVPPAVQAAIDAAVGESETRMTQHILASEERTKTVIKTTVTQAVSEALLLRAGVERGC